MARQLVLSKIQYYYIKNERSGWVLSLQERQDQYHVQGTKVVIQRKVDNADDSRQLWYLEDAGDGYYYIVSKSSQLVLDIHSGSWQMKAPLIVWPKNSPPTIIANQKWKIDLEEGAIVSQLNGQLVEVQNPDSVGSPVIMMRKKRESEDASPQRWVFEPIP